jgi:hypothetical protein
VPHSVRIYADVPPRPPRRNFAARQITESADDNRDGRAGNRTLELDAISSNLNLIVSLIAAVCECPIASDVTTKGMVRSFSEIKS